MKKKYARANEDYNNVDIKKLQITKPSGKQ